MSGKKDEVGSQPMKGTPTPKGEAEGPGVDTLTTTPNQNQPDQRQQTPPAPEPHHGFPSDPIRRDHDGGTLGWHDPPQQDQRQQRMRSDPGQDISASYSAAIDSIAAGAKKLMDAGMGAQAAGDLAAKVYLDILDGGPC